MADWVQDLCVKTAPYRQLISFANVFLFLNRSVEKELHLLFRRRDPIKFQLLLVENFTCKNNQGVYKTMALVLSNIEYRKWVDFTFLPITELEAIKNVAVF